MKHSGQAPIGEGEYIREKLEETMTQEIDKALILVIAPSGYGKSTFVRQYFSKREELPCIWFPMQREERDENWLWRRLCNKAHEYSTEIYERISVVGIPKSEQEISYVARVLNKYLKRPVYLVLDDYQECNGDFINHLLEAVVREVPYLHIVLISRVYPDIPYEELFLRGYCAAFNQQNLTLSLEETAQIFAANELTLSEQELTALYEYTDGWISAVYLSLFEYKKRGGFGYFLGVNRLLKTAIFDKLTSLMKEFYMKVSLFDWFDMGGASYVTELEFPESVLQESQEKFGFLYYDAKTHSYQMHTLLRAVAEAELEKSGIDVLRLYHRAGEWSEKKKAFVMAVNYYRKAKDWEKIAGLYAGENGRSMIEQAPEVFEGLRENIEGCIWENHLMALINYLSFLVMKEPAENVRPLYEQTMQEIAESDRWKSDKRILGEMSVIDAALQFNDIGRMNTSLQRACELLGYQTSSILGNSLLTYGTVCMTVLYHRESGMLAKVIAGEKEYAKYYMHLTRGGQEGWDDFFDAEYAMLTGDMDTAYTLAERVCGQTTFRQQTCIVISCYYMVLRCLIYRGEKAKFEHRMHEMSERLDAVVNPVLLTDMELVQGYMYSCIGEKNRMPEWLRNFKLENCSKAVRNIRAGCMTYGKLLCVDKNWEMLDLVAEQMIVPYESTVHIQTLITGYVYKAVAKYYLGQEELAKEYLAEAVKLAEPDGLTIPFWENGAELMPLLNSAEPGSFLASILPQARQYEKGVRAFGEKGEAKKPILTKRERELMEYVKEGCRNAEIGEKMHIAQVTVEKNLTSIYRKLEVTNRTAAIKRLEELE